MMAVIKKYGWFGFIILCALILRTWDISSNRFVFYDEGMYLGQNRELLELIQANPARNIGEWGAILGVLFKAAVSSTKSFWLFLINLRVFSVGTEAWYVSRLISCASGLLTLGLVFIVARRYFNNRRIALLSTAILAILPSHVFYSRLGMQESLCTLLFFSAMALYLFAKGLSWRPFVVGLLLALTFHCNYRMIIAPIFLCVIEGYNVLLLKQRFDVKKFFPALLTFIGLVWWVGSLFDGVNHQVTFGWMGHQAQDASGKFDPLKLFAFPLNTFILEGFFIGAFFWYGLWQARLQQWAKLLPLMLVLTQMAIFSIAADQGARYLCVVLPFFAMSCAQAMDVLLAQQRRVLVLTIIVFAFVAMGWQSLILTINKSSYQQAVEQIVRVDPQAKIIATQPLVTQLFVKQSSRVVECPKTANGLIDLVKQGYYYLILDPQAYISWARDDQKFNTQLLPFLEDIRLTGPVSTLPHFNQALLTRFVLDHNEHVIDSMRFLNQHPKGMDIEIYDLRRAIRQLIQK